MNNETGTLKRIQKLGILLSIREIYLFARNLYGFYFHPFLTTKRIIEGKDWSQTVLIFGLPIYLWLGWIFILLISRIFIFGELKFGFWAKTSFILVSFIVSLLFLFISYSLWSYFNKTRRNRICEWKKN